MTWRARGSALPDRRAVRWPRARWAGRLSGKLASHTGVSMVLQGLAQGTRLSSLMWSVQFLPALDVSPQFFSPKPSLLASDDPLGKNLNELHANSLAQIHQNTDTSPLCQ